MPHSIFVTVSEFLNNGGTMSNNRQLYKVTEYCTYDPIGWFDRSVQVTNPFMIIVSQSNRTFQLNIETVYVKVECTPIYK